MSKQPVVILAYGEGGHKKEMTLLLDHIVGSELNFVSLGPTPIHQSITHFTLGDVRHKQSRIKSVGMAIYGSIKALTTTLQVCRQYKVTGIISTGPGIAILPSIVLRLFGKKVVFVETFCRFYTRSFTGRVMSKLCHEFWVQNKQQLALYKNARYCGRL
ncbi:MULTISPECIES: PssD/Cps14F family polysaccharide biosynthesis glycosyltransferase [Pseudoalteromonas]|uniref:PssD/Cps14F family polysaccharide biosynthesis glycosyltransferase n=1 Tax=Pseudoalteromonas TaxID=53246 RepID=UPI0019CF9445|nr:MULTISPECIES: PssD/Cps14F family polysaccharide biosynthesis glycosyltransferase [Pseudoalteromonas]MBR8842477.1 hypothetical protein [Pseudoalteromonas sp. JC3]QUI69724.1 hypothetical protein GSF13_07930 [Pseudoalteromonas sp. M8]UDM62795.1 hypothetical protein KIJ96_06020 [Pseudoalteromonas piscicida]WJE09405.1 PssD/Cps14F family polysaccharide biosynthesis glycosyltransferase [Pseudoalteromonas sp. JC3]